MKIKPKGIMKTIVKSILYLFGWEGNPLLLIDHHKFHKSDYDAIRSDWENIGLDIYSAMKSYENK